MKDYARNLWLWLTGWSKLDTLEFKDGWTAWGWKPFWFPYATTYLLGCLAGYGVVSLSRAWYERSECFRGPMGNIIHMPGHRWTPAYPFAAFMTRRLNWLVPGKHGVNAGGLLWGSKCLRKMT